VKFNLKSQLMRDALDVNGNPNHSAKIQRFCSSMGVAAACILFFTQLAISARAQIALPGPGVINTIAGDGNGGFAGDGGPATEAYLNDPDGVEVDTSGDVYIADSFNNRIRKVSAATGDISTIAGNGTGGYSGDGGAATAAELNDPTGVALDPAGNIYIADWNNYRIRLICASSTSPIHGTTCPVAGDIITIAGNGTDGYSGDGGPATSAKLSRTGQIAIDSSGNVNFSDFDNCRIRKVTASTGYISTVAGNGTCAYSGDGGLATSAELNYPVGVAVDSSGNIYIADEFNSRIRKVTASTHDISTIAGNGTAGFAGDGGLATSAEVKYPTGVSIDSLGNVYIGDTFNQRVRVVNASSSDISTFAGTGTQGYTGDGGAATSAELYVPSTIAFDSAINVYIVDGGNNVIRVVGHQTTAVVVATMTLGSAGNSSAGTAPQRKNLTQCYTGCSSKSPTGGPATAYCTTSVQTTAESEGCSAYGPVPTLSVTNPGSGSLASVISSGNNAGGSDTPSALSSAYGTSTNDTYCTSDPYRNLTTGIPGLTLPGCVSDSTTVLSQTTSGTSTDSLFPATWVVSGSSHNGDTADHYVRESWWSIPCSTYNYIEHVEYDTNYSASNGQYYGFGLHWSKDAPLVAGGTGQMFQYDPQGGSWRTLQFNPVGGGTPVTTFPVSCGQVIHTRVFMHRGSITACTNASPSNCFFYDQMYVQNCGSSSGTCSSSPVGTLYNLVDAQTGAAPGGIPKDYGWAPYEPSLQIQIDTQAAGTAAVNFDSDSLVLYHF
jgi:sugar lactone lactonase YvrE